jgi:AraC-like DNA-binding protein
VYVSVFLVRVIVAELKRRGVKEQVLLERAGLTAEELSDPTRRLPTDRYEAFVRAARALTENDMSTGLHVGESWPTSGYLVGHIFANASSVRDAISLAMRFRNLVHETMCLRLVEHGDLATIVYESHSRDEDNARFEAEAMLVFLFRMGHLLAGFHTPPYAVTFMHARPADVTPYTRIFGREPVFGASCNGITCARIILDVPNAHSDPAVSALLERRAERLLADQDSDAHLVDRVRDLLRLGTDLSSMTCERIAERLGTSTRALQRRLRSRGTSLSLLTDEVRRTMACNALADGNVPIKEVADRLGFSEPSAFHRAFKRWTGLTPHGFRAQQRDGGGNDVGASA